MDENQKDEKQVENKDEPFFTYLLKNPELMFKWLIIGFAAIILIINLVRMF